jgi:hypothetical protein
MHPRTIAALALVLLAVPCPAALADNFSTGTQASLRFGVYEVLLTGDGGADNPFDTPVSVTFTPPSGPADALTVDAFYDGGGTWRARVYVSQTGAWTWTSACATDEKLDGLSGAFEAAGSNLRGRLLIHPKNPRQWMTEDGRWFLNLNDTSYFLLCAHDGLGNPVTDEDFRDYVKDAVDHGITSFRSWAANGPKPFTSSPGNSDRHRWDDLFADKDYTRPNLDALRLADQRLRWMLDHYPDVGVQFILFPLGKPYASDETFWTKLPVDNRQRIMRYLIARFAAYPAIFWLVVNDCIYTIDPAMLPYAEMHQALNGRTYPNAEAMAREVGNYFLEHDPWRHPLSTGVARTVPFRFGDEEWATYVHLEHRFDFGAKGYAAHQQFHKPVFLGEDRYEQDHPGVHDPLDMRYFQRRLYWSWLLAGGSANYGGRWWAVHPYRQTGNRPVQSPRNPAVTHGQLVGLDSVRFIRDFFTERKIQLSNFEPDLDRVKDATGATGGGAPRLMRRGNAEFLVYHPHATSDDRQARVRADATAQVQIDLRQAEGTFSVEWFRAEDGQSQEGQAVTGGDWRTLTAPWGGADVVVWLRMKDEDRRPTTSAASRRINRSTWWTLQDGVKVFRKGHDRIPIVGDDVL